MICNMILQNIDYINSECINYFVLRNVMYLD